MKARLRVATALSVAALVCGTPAFAANNNGHGKGGSPSVDTPTATASASPSARGNSATAKGKTVRLEVTITGTLTDTPTASASPLHMVVKTVPAASIKQLAPGLRNSTISVVVSSLSLVRRNGAAVTAFSALKGGDHVTVKLTATHVGSAWTYTATRVNASGA